MTPLSQEACATICGWLAREDFKDQLKAAYDADAGRRTDNAKKRSAWKLTARQQFSDLARKENKKQFWKLVLEPDSMRNTSEIRDLKS